MFGILFPLIVILGLEQLDDLTGSLGTGVADVGLGASVGFLERTNTIHQFLPFTNNNPVSQTLIRHTVIMKYSLG